jgi:acylpyruvate hydrolase
LLEAKGRRRRVARKPPVWMKGGDTCEIDIEDVGILSNPIVDET